MTQRFQDKYPVSPSQIETARLCLRKWGLDKLDKVPRPANRHAQRGTDAHSVLEAWMTEGTPINTDTDIGKIVSSGLRFLPRPHSHLVEVNFKFQTPNATYHGIKDLKSKPDGTPVLRVWDHKTTRDFRWLKGPVKLRRDPQANIYAMSEIVEAEKEGLQWERVEQNWIYYLAEPSKPQARKVQLHVLRDESVEIPDCPKEVNPDNFGFMYRDELEERFAEIEDTSAQLLEYWRQHERGEIKGSQLPYDATACGAFGGCPYANKACKLTVSERVESMEKQLSLAEKMKRAREVQEGNEEESKPAATSSKPASTPKVSEEAAAKAEKIKTASVKQQSKPPATNPPEQANGVDPDAPKVKVSPGDRMQMAAYALQGLLASGLYDRQLGTPDGCSNVASLAVRIADSTIAELSK